MKNNTQFYNLKKNVDMDIEANYLSFERAGPNPTLKQNWPGLSLFQNI